VPFIYYGEEIGMLGKKPDEDIRRPMQWSAEANAGFTAENPWRNPFLGYEARNVVLQTADSTSLFNHYRALIHLRNAHEALRIGEWQQVEVSDRKLYAYLRHSDDQVLLVLINLDDEPVIDYNLSLETGPLSEVGTAVTLFGNAVALSPTLNGNGGFAQYTPIETLPAQSSFIIQLK
jgi:glycosidase